MRELRIGQVLVVCLGLWCCDMGTVWVITQHVWSGRVSLFVCRSICRLIWMRNIQEIYKVLILVRVLMWYRGVDRGSIGVQTVGIYGNLEVG